MPIKRAYDLAVGDVLTNVDCGDGTTPCEITAEVVEVHERSNPDNDAPLHMDIVVSEPGSDIGIDLGFQPGEPVEIADPALSAAEAALLARLEQAIAHEAADQEGAAGPMLPGRDNLPGLAGNSFWRCMCTAQGLRVAQNIVRERLGLPLLGDEEPEGSDV